MGDQEQMERLESIILGANQQRKQENSEAGYKTDFLAFFCLYTAPIDEAEEDAQWIIHT